MKKTYNQPTIELVEVAIEQGIAASIESANFSLNGYDEPEAIGW